VAAESLVFVATDCVMKSLFPLKSDAALPPLVIEDFIMFLFSFSDIVVDFS
jgi:hypothetical protein